MKIRYITSNLQKFEEARHVLSDWDLEHIPLELKEIQGTNEEIIKAKAVEALRIIKHPLIVEDVSLCCSAIGGLPGPYIKDFLKKIGEKGLSEMIHKYDDHSVELICFVGYIEPDQEPLVFKGVLKGSIVSPRGVTKHGVYSWNTIVQPEGFDKTFGEMTIKEHSSFSMRYLALTKLKHYLEHHSL